MERCAEIHSLFSKLKVDSGHQRLTQHRRSNARAIGGGSYDWRHYADFNRRYRVELRAASLRHHPILAGLDERPRRQSILRPPPKRLV
jgi:hypothetical protein